MSKKITLATVKSFIKKNKDKLFIQHLSSFDGMVDGVRPSENKEFHKAEVYTPVAGTVGEAAECGVRGAWFVRQSRDYFNHFSDDKYEGIEVSNSCGNFILAVEKAA